MQFDWIYVTGDLPPHNVWNQTREDQVRETSRLDGAVVIFALIHSFAITFWGAEGAPILFSVLGFSMASCS